MKKQLPTWVFPTVKVIVTITYYILLVSFIIFTAIAGLKLAGLDFSKSNERNYVSMTVSWSPPDPQLKTSPGEPRLYLRPEQQRGAVASPGPVGAGVLILALGLVSLGASVWLFRLLRQIFVTVRMDSPFHPTNARHIGLMGLVLLGQTALELGLKWALYYLSLPFLHRIRLEYPQYSNVNNYPGLSIDSEAAWLLGLILLALAQVYRRGIELQAESELTI